MSSRDMQWKRMNYKTPDNVIIFYDYLCKFILVWFNRQDPKYKSGLLSKQYKHFFLYTDELNYL